jgi:hypothetical protein
LGSKQREKAERERKKLRIFESLEKFTVEGQGLGTATKWPKNSSSAKFRKIMGVGSKHLSVNARIRKWEKYEGDWI